MDTLTGTFEVAAEVLVATEFDGVVTFEECVIIGGELEVGVTFAAPEVAEPEVVTGRDGAAVLQPARMTLAPSSSAVKVEVRISDSASGQKRKSVSSP